MDAVTMDVGPEAMAGSVDERLSVPRPLDDGAARPIHLEPPQFPMSCRCLLDERHGGIPRIPGRGKRSGVSVQDLDACKTNPGDVSKHCAGIRQFAPQIQEDDLAVAYPAVPLA